MSAYDCYEDVDTRSPGWTVNTDTLTIQEGKTSSNLAECWSLSRSYTSDTPWSSCGYVVVVLRIISATNIEVVNMTYRVDQQRS